MNKWSKGLVLALSVAALGACTSTPKSKPATGTTPGAAVEERTAPRTQGPETSGLPRDGGVTGSPIEGGAGGTAGTAGTQGAGGIPTQRVVQFEFDSSEILDEDRSTLDQHGDYLMANTGTTVTLEGHTDERGSREYNMALGERRANAVRQYLELKGVSGTQLKTVSYGEERPVATGSDEDSWSQNRRVELVYPNR